MQEPLPTEGGTGGGAPPSIVAIGDSITWGFPYGPHASWVRRVSDALGVEIRNLGVNGDTLADVRARLPRALALGPRCCIVSGGTNDASLGRPPEEMARDLGAMVEQLREAGVFPLVGMPPPYNDAHCEKQLASYRHFVNAFAGTRGVRVIHFDRVFRDEEGEIIPNLLADDTHPSPEGYAAMARLVVETDALAPCLGDAP
jgi:lysophospholipase L1-like esterase